MPDDRALYAWLRTDALSLSRHAALRPAGGFWPRLARPYGRARAAEGRARRLRLGRARRLRGRGLMAGAGALPCFVQWLRHPEYRRIDHAAAAGAGTSAMVPVLLSHGTGPGGTGRQSPRVRQAPVAALVTELEIR